uniref:Uncharacterized protein n=1 Tax=Cacopsylla melanoneura TaxID=428564 RepID=A0A8D8VIK0_9HEMI
MSTSSIMMSALTLTGFEPTISWLDTPTTIPPLPDILPYNCSLPPLTESDSDADSEPEPEADFIKYIYPVRSRILRKKFWHGYHQYHHPRHYVTTDRYHHHICSSSNSSTFFSHIRLLLRPSICLLFLLPFLFCIFVFYFFFTSFATVFQPTRSSLEKIGEKGERKYKGGLMEY